MVEFLSDVICSRIVSAVSHSYKPVMKLSYQLLAVADDDTELNATTYWLYKVSLSLSHLPTITSRHIIFILLDDFSLYKIILVCFRKYDVLIPDNTVRLVQGVSSTVPLCVLPSVWIRRYVAMKTRLDNIWSTKPQ